MCEAEDASLQRGMNYRLRGGVSVILMSRRVGAPYTDRVEGDGRVLIYEGHNVPRSKENPDPESVDQQMRLPGGGLTQNGLFYEAARRSRRDRQPVELLRAYEKIRKGIWVYNGTFSLTDAWVSTTTGRKIFKFKFELSQRSSADATLTSAGSDPARTRIIPAQVKLEVWKRDRGRCVRCGRTDNLHFDHILPYSKGGTSLLAENIQILCARHNLAKRDRIE